MKALSRLALVPLLLAVQIVQAENGSLGMLGRLLNRSHGNIAVGVLNSSRVDASAQASGGGKAAAAAVIADQNKSRKPGSLNLSLGVLQNSQIRARAVANGRNSRAYAGGVIAVDE